MSNPFQDSFSEAPQGSDPLRERFPDMQPVTKVPPLSTVNGIGFTVYGRRDFDADTGTYVKTYVFCILFVPLFAVRAYRVADAVPGWYFLGRVPLSGLAKFWNFFVLVLIAGGIGLGWWNHYSGTPEYQAGRLLAQADQMAGEGKLEAAANDYRQVALGSTPHAAAARTKLGELFDSAAAQNNPKEAVKALRIAVDVHHSGRTIDKLFERGLALAKKQPDNDPHAALALADAVAPLAPNSKELMALRLPILQKLVEQNRANVDLLSELALIHEARREFAACEKLLAPQAAKLGDKEGARILGQIYAHQGKIEEAYPLLQEYTEKRLKRWRTVEGAQINAVKQIQGEVLEELKKKTAPGFDFKRFNIVGEAEKNRMLDDYFVQRLKDHPRYRKAQVELAQEARVVPVAIDFGIVLLRRGQAMADPAARKKELERAEKTFLAVRSAAGGLQEFNLFLGQVYYWLGRHDEGRKLFDALVETKRTETMLDVATALREVGARSEARLLAEKVYNQETDRRKKYSAADLCSVLAIELDDVITWLGRADPSDPKVQADLSNSRGHKALREGKEAEAAKYYREAARIYAEMPESFVSLNNGALSQIGLFHVTGERAALQLALANQEKALALKPGDSILLRNVADSLMSSALWDVIGRDIDLAAVRRTGSFDFFQFLYTDAKSRAALQERVKNFPDIAKAHGHYNRLRVLAPKDPAAYVTLSRLYSFTNELEKWRELGKRLEETDLDQVDALQKLLENYQGKNDDKLKKDLQGNSAHLVENLQRGRKVGGATLAVAVQDMINTKLFGSWLGLAVDADELVSLAQQADKAAPSYGTRGLVMVALLFRAHQALVKQEPEYARLAEKGQRTLGSSYLIAVALSGTGPAQKACQNHADVQRVQNMLLAEKTRFPEDADEWRWAMLKSTFPDEAGQLAEKVLKSESLRLEHAIGEKTTPLSASLAYRQHWGLLMAGDQDRARSVLKRLADKGVPLP